jgi:uncharacterized RDD family membrane protein YckC
MTSSPAPPGDGDGPRQEGIWEDGRDESGAPADAPAHVHMPTPGRTAAASRGLTRTLTSTARTPGPGGLLIADVPNRMLGLAIDILVLSVTGFLLAWLLGGLVEEAGAIDAAGGGLDVVAFLVVLVVQLLISFGYFAASWRSYSATPGMRLLGLRIGDEADARTISWRGATARWVLLGVPAVLASLAVYVPHLVGLVLGAVGAAWLLLLLYTMAQRPTRQGLHDRLAHTIVFRSRRPTA